MGRRIKKTVSSTDTMYLYNSEDIVKETAGGVDTEYLHGIGVDEPLIVNMTGTEYYLF
jgi:hypothetical protein